MYTGMNSNLPGQRVGAAQGEGLGKGGPECLGVVAGRGCSVIYARVDDRLGGVLLAPVAKLREARGRRGPK